VRSSSARDFIVGLFVCAGLATIAYLSLQVGGLSLTRPAELTLFADFDDIGGLTDRAPVRISGVTVGRVRAIRLDSDLRARVTLQVPSDLELTVDSSAAIRTSGLLGDQFIALEPGAEDEFLTDGEEFSFTESALNLDKLIGTLVHGSATD
jgi:phospholipid/cholesterol/gamma-HCH transport system substrate-binding protein